jgi:hypothetical protein
MRERVRRGALLTQAGRPAWFGEAPTAQEVRRDALLTLSLIYGKYGKY